MTVLKRLKQLVEINSYTGNKPGVDAVRRLCSAWLEPLGFSSQLFCRQHIGDHLLLTTARCDGDRILLVGHLDTVFPPDSYDHYHEDGTWVHGPGVCDMKGGLVVAIEALQRVYQKFGELKNIDFLLVSDEETGSDDSKPLTQKIVQEYHACLVLEAAGPNLELVTARKGVGTFTLEITGHKAHSGAAFLKGIDANQEAAHKLLKLSALTDIDKGTTVNVGRVSGGVGANTVSGEASLLFEVRYACNAEKIRLLTAIEHLTTETLIPGTHTRLSGLIQRDVMEESKPQQRLLQRIRQISGQILPTERRGGVSDANLAAVMGVPTLDGFGPYGDGDHTHQERALISSFDTRIDLLAAVVGYQQQHCYLGMEMGDETDSRIMDVSELRRRPD